MKKSKKGNEHCDSKERCRWYYTDENLDNWIKADYLFIGFRGDIYPVLPDILDRLLNIM